MRKVGNGLLEREAKRDTDDVAGEVACISIEVESKCKMKNAGRDSLHWFVKAEMCDRCRKVVNSTVEIITKFEVCDVR